MIANASLSQRCARHPFLCLALLGPIGWFSWPVSGWFAGAFLLATIFGFTARKLLPSPADKLSVSFTVFLALLLRCLSEAAKYIAFGIGIVAVMQLLAVAFSEAFSPEFMTAYEEYLSLAFQEITGLISFPFFLIVLSSLLIINMILPFSGLVNKFLYAKSLISRCVLVLIGATSFSFFATETVRLHDPQWRKAEYAKATLILSDISEINRKTVAAVWLQKQVKQANAETTQDYRNFFQHVNTFRPSVFGQGYGSYAESYKEEVIRNAARGVAERAPKAQAASTRSRGALDEELIAIQAHVETPNAEETLVELRDRTAKLTAAKARYEAIRKAAFETATEMLVQIVPRSEQALTRAFIEEVSSSVARSALQTLKPYFPSGQSAKELAESWIPASETGKLVQSEWKIGLKPLAQAPLGASSEMAMSMLASQLQTRAALQAAQMRRYTPPSTFRPTAPTSSWRLPRVRFRP
jgi:hypothetical protein